MSISVECLHRVSCNLQDVVADKSQWRRILDEIADATGCIGVAVLPYEPNGQALIGSSLEEAFRAYFAEGWHIRDTRRRGIPLQLRGFATSDDDVIGDDELRKDPYYNEFLPTTELRWWAGLGFSAGPAMHCLGLQRTNRQGRFTAKEKAIIQSLSRRMSEVATLSYNVERAIIAGSIDVLARMEVAAFTIDRQGRVIASNAAADLSLGEDIRVRNGKIVIRDHAAAIEYERLVRQIQYLPEGRSLNAGVLVVHRANGTDLLLRALPLDGAARFPFCGAVAMFTMTELKKPAAPHPLVVGKALRLTPSETALAVQLAMGNSLERAAEALEICKETARTQLKSVFGKTGTHRQGELVALLGSLPAEPRPPAPLANDPADTQA